MKVRIPPILLKNSEVAELAKDWFALPSNNAIDNPRAGDLDSNIAGNGRVNEFFNTIHPSATFAFNGGIDRSRPLPDVRLLRQGDFPVIILSSDASEIGREDQ